MNMNRICSGIMIVLVLIVVVSSRIFSQEILSIAVTSDNAQVLFSESGKYGGYIDEGREYSVAIREGADITKVIGRLNATRVLGQIDKEVPILRAFIGDSLAITYTYKNSNRNNPNILIWRIPECTIVDSLFTAENVVLQLADKKTLLLKDKYAGVSNDSSWYYTYNVETKVRKNVIKTINEIQFVVGKVYEGTFLVRKDSIIQRISIDEGKILSTYAVIENLKSGVGASSLPNYATSVTGDKLFTIPRKAEKNLVEISTVTGNIRKIMDLPSNINSGSKLRLHPDGKTLYVLSAKSYVIDIETQKIENFEVRIGERDISEISWSNTDDRMFISTNVFCYLSEDGGFGNLKVVARNGVVGDIVKGLQDSVIYITAGVSAAVDDRILKVNTNNRKVELFASTITGEMIYNHNMMLQSEKCMDLDSTKKIVGFESNVVICVPDKFTGSSLALSEKRDWLAGMLVNKGYGVYDVVNNVLQRYPAPNLGQGGISRFYENTNELMIFGTNGSYKLNLSSKMMDSLSLKEYKGTFVGFNGKDVTDSLGKSGVSLRQGKFYYYNSIEQAGVQVEIPEDVGVSYVGINKKGTRIFALDRKGVFRVYSAPELLVVAEIQLPIIGWEYPGSSEFYYDPNNEILAYSTFYGELHVSHWPESASSITSDSPLNTKVQTQTAELVLNNEFSITSSSLPIELYCINIQGQRIELPFVVKSTKEGLHNIDVAAGLLKSGFYQIVVSTDSGVITKAVIII